ncbi:probable E3 ubiquitin-protein ligase TRIML1 [Sarcophilus harrisii]|uniref:probable E3 ubiquitin-protein ligase TRIML1 n=1 Tax=Sarcophilus harrisii TaxID=9305 RepID=UPI00062B6698|nr:probable E3 ubiquitin-protein ligase TRIML1 [Sarcophilus harrisii]
MTNTSTEDPVESLFDQFSNSLVYSITNIGKRSRKEVVTYPESTMSEKRTKRPRNMDAKNWFESLKVDATCRLCLRYFVDPIIILCGHTFCRECLCNFWKKLNISAFCPICKTKSGLTDIVYNRRLQNLANINKMLRPHLLQTIRDLPICDKHGKEQTLFCEEDHRPLCGPCFLTTDHKEHKVLLLEVAVSQCMEKLEATCNTLRSKKEKFQMELSSERIREIYCKDGGCVLQKLVISEYEKMHQFFWEEEQFQLQILDKEERDLKNKESLFQKILNLLMNSENQSVERIKAQKQSVKSEFEKKHQCLSEEKELHLRILDQQVKDNLAKFEKSKTKMKQMINNLEIVILEIEKNYDKLPIEMLQDAKGILESSMDLLLQDSIIASPRWTMYPISGMKEMLLTFHRNIFLDPKIANPHRILYEDLHNVTYNSVPQDVPDNPQRFDFILCVLADQKFTSGKHYWEVVVENKKLWEVGFCTLMNRRKGNVQRFYGDKFTLVHFTCNDEFCLSCLYQKVPLSQPLHKVGIFLDYERGHIAFYNGTDGTVIYSFSNENFQGPLYPYFSPWFPNGKNTFGPLYV